MTYCLLFRTQYVLYVTCGTMYILHLSFIYYIYRMTGIQNICFINLMPGSVQWQPASVQWQPGSGQWQPGGSARYMCVYIGVYWC